MKITTLGLVITAAFTSYSGFAQVQEEQPIPLSKQSIQDNKQPQDMKKILSQYDKDGDGSLNESELKEYIQANELSSQSSNEQARKGDKVTVTQKPAKITVNQKPANITVKQPKPEVTITSQDPDITIDQRKPEVNVDQSDPKVRVSAGKPAVDVDREDPEVKVDQPEADVSIESEDPQIKVNEER